MWALANQTPYAAESNWTRDKDGFHVWIVAIKATFDILERGRLRLADEQPAPVLAPEYFTNAGPSSLRLDSDLLAAKRTTDVNVVAHAHAPSARPVALVPVSMRAGALEKGLLVYGERRHVGGRLTSPRPFVAHPIMYEHAFGGSDLSDLDPKNHRLDERNPVGRGVACRGADLEDKLAHSIEHVHGHYSESGPAGFGPLDSAWLPRRLLAGTYDSRWEATKRPLLPDDYDPAFAQSAPADQRPLQPFRGGERVELLNLTPEGVLRFELPSIALELTTRIAGRQERHVPLLTTLLIEAEKKRFALIWQSALSVAAPDADYLDRTEIVERRGGA